MSDQEVVDLCRDAKHPSQAAQSVLTFAEELGAQDNCTVMVVPLKAWGKVGGNDGTRERREMRRSKIDLFRDNRR
jgi:protein phosphatase PTC6